ncbi:unnamed protein product [Boreogadus saida]
MSSAGDKAVLSQSQGAGCRGQQGEEEEEAAGMSRSVTTEPGLEPGEGEEEEAEGDCFEDGLRCRPYSRLRSLPGWQQQQHTQLLSPPGQLYVSSMLAEETAVNWGCVHIQCRFKDFRGPQ